MRARSSSPTVPTVGASFVATDDDVVVDGSGSALDIPYPDISLVAGVFGPAYVLPVFTLMNDSPSTPFFKNTNPAVSSAYANRSGLLIEKDYWSIYLNQPFQPSKDQDYDPSTEVPMLGVKLATLA